MADWVRNKTSWDKMFDFKQKDIGTNGPQQDSIEEQEHHDQPTGKFNGNSITAPDRIEQGQGHTYVKGQRKKDDIIPQYNKSGNISGKSVSRFVNGDSRDMPPDNIAERPVQTVS